MHHTDPVDRAYAILGLRPGSSSSEIKRRYKHLVKTWHPDRWAGDPTSQAEAAQRMREINLAWQVLTESARAMAPPPSAQLPPVPRRDSQLSSSRTGGPCSRMVRNTHGQALGTNRRRPPSITSSRRA